MVRKCFWRRLETVAMVSGWVGIAGSFISIIFFGFCLVYVDILKKLIDDLQPGDKDDEELRMLLVRTFMLQLSLNAMNLAASFGLIVGTLRYFAPIFDWEFIFVTKITKPRGTNKKNFYSVKPARATQKLNV